MNIEYRHANINDLESLSILENNSFTSDVLSKKSLKRFILAHNATVLVATTHTQLAGYILVLYRKSTTQARIYSLAVLKEFRQQKVATHLLDHAENEITKMKCKTIILEVDVKNISAIHFYEKFGFEVFDLHESFYEDGSDALRMKKILT
jgi:ribosomal protein S18 acetylase RimI-like enzyme